LLRLDLKNDEKVKASAYTEIPGKNLGIIGHLSDLAYFRASIGPKEAL
jgi:hypothetical protein